jgi:hypothetical protein
VAATLPSAVPSAVIHVLAEQGALEQVLAQIEALRQAQPTDPTTAPPSIDYEALAREADAAEAARTATPPQAPPWENPTPAPETEAAPETDAEAAADAEAEAAPEADAEAEPEPEAETETEPEPEPESEPAPEPEADAEAAPTVGGASDWSHWFTTPTDEPDRDGDGGEDGGEPPWGGGSSPQPPPEPTDPDGGGGATAATPDTDEANKTAAQQDSPWSVQQRQPQAPAAFTAPRRPRPAVTLGGTLIPLDQLADMLRDGATIKALPVPTAAPATGYKFTGTIREFIQCRDIRCRFPGCNRKAEYADIDHTLPHGDGGATHPSNGKVLCREHHLAKTFGVGWRDEQLPNGEVRWTAPTGHTYLTQPTTRVLFPDWDPTTATLPPPTRTRRRRAHPGITMPTRKRTREQDRQQHIKAERDHNALQRALGKPPRRRRFPSFSGHGAVR